MIIRLLLTLLMSQVFFFSQADAGLFQKNGYTFDDAIKKLEPHKAFYDIDLIATRSGSPIINISGRMYYEWRPSCEGWITDHRFNLLYEYADSPGMEITSDFSTFESFDGETFSFSAKRKRDDQVYQEFRGSADLSEEQSVADFTIPEDLSFDLEKPTYFPMTHTVKMIQKALNKDKFFNAVVFDGSDDEGPVIINTFIGKNVDADKSLKKIDAIDYSLLKSKAWNIRMAVFPQETEEESASDYEMSIVFHENGVISDMQVDYDDFAVNQKLVALEKIEDSGCQ